MSHRVPDFSKAEAEVLKRIRGVCLDVDDTLSTHGKLTSQAYADLWALQAAGFAVVPITGRPAGWCDHMARFWPVNAVVGENGAFTFFMQEGVRRRLNTPTDLEENELRSKLSELRQKIQVQFPNAKWASDQSYREFDLAIDICEDVPTWPKQEVEKLLDLCHAEGAHAKLSSIHVNTWFGNYDKRKGFEVWQAAGMPGCQFKLGAPLKRNEWIYIGDSPNDEPMFESFAYSVGVANIEKYLNQLKHPPTWMTQAESGEGFSEMTRHLIAIRG